MNTPSPAAARQWPLFEALRGEQGGDIGRDLLAGLMLAAIAIPEQMATARLGGFAPQIGFIAFVAAAVGFALFGANRQLSAGADSTITPIFAGTLALIATAGSPHYLELAAALALMVGLLVALAGVFKLGWIADLLSTPVITGFLAGISLHIVLSQAPSILGLPEESGDVYHRLAAVWSQAHGLSLASLAIGAGVFAITFGSEKINPRIPGALVALIAASAATFILHLDRHGVAVLGTVPAIFPHPAAPHLSLAEGAKLIGLAFIIALVVMVQTAATTRAFSGGSEDPDVNRDFVGVGIGSLLSGALGAFPVNASPPRTSVVAGSGGRSQYAGLAAAVAVLSLAAFGTPVLAYVPAAALGGILLFVAERIFHLSTFADIWRRTRAEFALALATTVLIVALPIQTGVGLGIVLSLIHGVFTTTRAAPIPFERVAGTTVWWPASQTHPGETDAAIAVMGFQAPLSFLNAYDFRRGIVATITAGAGTTKLFVLEASSMVEIDFTGAMVLRDVIAKARAAGMDFAVARLESVRAQAAFERQGVAALLGEDHQFHSVDAAIQALGPKSSMANTRPTPRA
jgi:SulP family sulfate permease